MIVIAQISDLHLDGGERATARAKQVLASLGELADRLDVLLVSGDIADHGEPAEYALARQLLDLPCPVLVLPGNHDDRAAFAAGLLDAEPSVLELNRSVRIAGADFLLCDSTVPGEDYGRLSEPTLDWLDGALAAGEDDVPAFVCFHHPPVDLHVPFVDRIRQFGAERLAEIIGWHPRVVAVLCGHAHTAAVSRFADRPLLVAPGVVSTVRLPIESGPTIDLDLPPAMAFHLLGDDGRLVTHYRSGWPSG